MKEGYKQISINGMEVIEFEHEGMLYRTLPEEDHQYAISKDGIVVSIKSSLKKMSIYKHNGYNIIKLNTKNYRIPRLVGFVWVENTTDMSLSDLTIDHIDHNRNNDHMSNLRWLTLKENSRDGGMIEARPVSNGSKHFDSIADAARWIIESKKSESIIVNTVANKIQRSCNSYIKAYGYEWYYIE